jgi:hypothetical protein
MLCQVLVKRNINYHAKIDSNVIHENDSNDFASIIELAAGDVNFCFQTTDDYPKVLSVNFYPTSKDIYKTH